MKDYINQTLLAHKMHMTLVDPAKQSVDVAGEIASKAQAAESDAIMVGGSTGITQENLDQTVDEMKARCKLPVIYFPSRANAIAQRCDAIYFMSMLNSKNPRNITGEHSRGAPIIKRLGLETLSMGYIVVDPGMKVGEVGEADVVRRDDTERALGYALAAEYLGMSMVYLEAGSGAPSPVPSAMISAVKDSIGVPLIVGGGITDPERAQDAATAGADIIVTGTLVEDGDFEESLRALVRTVHDLK